MGRRRVCSRSLHYCPSHTRAPEASYTHSHHKSAPLCLSWIAAALANARPDGTSQSRAHGMWWWGRVEMTLWVCVGAWGWI